MARTQPNNQFTEVESKDLMQKCSLWHIWFITWRISQPKSNLCVTGLASVVTIIWYVVATPSTNVLLSISHRIASEAIPIGFSIIGLLLAGYLVFTSVSSPKMLAEMTRIRHEKSKLSYFKYNAFPFVSFIVDVLCYCIVCVLFKYISGMSTDATIDFGMYCKMLYAINTIMIYTSNFILVVGPIYLIMQLKSFIKNTNHVIFTAVQWIREEEDRS